MESIEIRLGVAQVRLRLVWQSDLRRRYHMLKYRLGQLTHCEYCTNPLKVGVVCFVFESIPEPIM